MADMGIALAIFLMLLGGIAGMICLWALLPKIPFMLGLAGAVYLFCLGAVGYGIETGRIERAPPQQGSPFR